jgi:prepilin-type N-terminal cleavage/methylation domain-containing protein
LEGFWIDLMATTLPTQRRRSGFTLLELLIVLAIIALLVSILIPSLGMARDRARQVACAANLRGIGLALSLYIDNNEQHLPWVVEPIWKTTGGVDFNVSADTPYSAMTVLTPYLGSNKVMVCPGAVLGYPTTPRFQVTYRFAAANNYDGQLNNVYNSSGVMQYVYSLKYLDGRKYEIKHVVPGTVPLQLADGPGPYYVARDFVEREATSGKFILPHLKNFNELQLDWSVSLARDPEFGLTYP